MAVEDYDIVLQTERADGSFRCRGFSGVPAASRSWIAIVCSGSEQGCKAIEELAAETEAALLGSSPEVTASDFDCSVTPLELNPADYPDRLKLLILVGADDRTIDDRAWYHKWNSDKDRAGLMILLPPGVYEDFFDASLRGIEKAQHLLRRINVGRWSTKLAELVPSVLGRAEVTSPINRIFISYRQVETSGLALQLFDRLVKERFDVFLDRFSIPPGYDFQRRLTQELEDKSMVLLLESPQIKTSKWTQHEIDFAKRRRLGVLALKMPTVDEKDVLVSVDAREPLLSRDFKKIDGQDGDEVNPESQLEDDALDRVMTRIKKVHADALFRRRHQLRTDLVAALRAEGIKVPYSAVGALKVVCEEDEHLLWPTTRPPVVEDFRSVHRTLRAGESRSSSSLAIIIGPLAALEPDRQEQLDWLREVSQCKAFDEGNLSDFARKLAAGDLT